jgi:hypothetical protein
MTKSVFLGLLLVSMMGFVLASEVVEPNAMNSEQAAGVVATEGTEKECCWDRVDFDRPLRPYERAQGPDCCWVPVWGETGR